jgi:hypothetical protein
MTGGGQKQKLPPNHVQIHVTQSSGPYHKKTDHIPSVPGHAMVDGHRSQFVDHNDHVWTCALSGMGRRQIDFQDGSSLLVGHAEVLHFRNSTTSNLPSNHQSQTRCLVTINKHK